MFKFQYHFVFSRVVPHFTFLLVSYSLYWESIIHSHYMLEREKRNVHSVLVGNLKERDNL